MSLVPRLFLYALCLFLVMLVYTGQKHATAAATLRPAGLMTAKLLAWSIAGALMMLGLQAVFID